MLLIRHCCDCALLLLSGGSNILNWSVDTHDCAKIPSSERELPARKKHLLRVGKLAVWGYFDSDEQPNIQRQMRSKKEITYV